MWETQLKITYKDYDFADPFTLRDKVNKLRDNLTPSKLMEIPGTQGRRTVVFRKMVSIDSVQVFSVIERSLSGVNFADRPSALTQKKKAKERILPFVTTYHPAVNNLKQTLMEQWSLIQNQPLLKTIFLKPLRTSYKRGKSLKDPL